MLSNAWLSILSKVAVFVGWSFGERQLAAPLRQTNLLAAHGIQDKER
jgi:hypothetical protein